MRAHATVLPPAAPAEPRAPTRLPDPWGVHVARTVLVKNLWPSHLRSGSVVQEWQPALSPLNCAPPSTYPRLQIHVAPGSYDAHYIALMIILLLALAAKQDYFPSRVFRGRLPSCLHSEYTKSGLVSWWSSQWQRGRELLSHCKVSCANRVLTWRSQKWLAA